MVQTEIRSASLLRWVGYGLLVLAFMDVVDILLPPQLMNPAWEFQTVGALVERVPVPLLGLALVFFDGISSRKNWEKLILRFLSGAAVVVGVLYLLLIPLAMSDVVRLNNQNNVQVGAQAGQQRARIEQLKTQLNQASSQDLNGLLERLDTQGRGAAINGPQDLKQKLSAEIAQAETQLQNQSDAARRSSRLSLLKNGVKWGVGALISGALFIRIGQLTRRGRSKSKARSAHRITT